MIAMRQLLLSLPTFPDAVPERTVESACTLAQLLDAGLTAHLPQLNSDRASWPAALGSFPLDLPRLMEELVMKSAANADAATKCLEALAPEYGVPLDLRRGLTTLYAPHQPLVDLARLHDLTILPLPEAKGFGGSAVQAVLFASGRPVVVLPEKGKRLSRLQRVVVAWDFSREAARALADALPILARAREVRVVTVLGEKHIETTARTADLEKYLTAHKIKHSLHSVALEGEGIGRFLMEYADGVDADMLVMGGYGHSRFKELVLGGASRTALKDPRLPVFLSH
jgi:nucleotide-binding universal stress UspA family protein